jgi:hypothetical protein
MIPCSHAVVFITKKLGLQPEMHCGSMHCTGTLIALYTQADGCMSVPTTMADLHDIGYVPVAPPEREKRRGRKPTRRIESQSRGSKRNKAATTILCPYCTQPGHNRRTCPSFVGAHNI